MVFSEWILGLVCISFEGNKLYIRRLCGRLWDFREFDLKRKGFFIREIEY